MEKHHLWYPRAAYRTSLERRFRDLACNKIWLDPDLHRLIHACNYPPKKPSQPDMQAALMRHDQGECPCRRIRK